MTRAYTNGKVLGLLTALYRHARGQSQVPQTLSPKLPRGLPWPLRLLWGFLERYRFERFVIGRPGYPEYLVRWTLKGQRYGADGKTFLHLFLRGDTDEALHDHPWSFESLILWGGYWEIIPDGRRQWYGPGSVVKRPAAWAHRVELPAGRLCLSLVKVGQKERGWGFHCAGGWQPWRAFQANLDAGLPGCGG